MTKFLCFLLLLSVAVHARVHHDTPLTDGPYNYTFTDWTLLQNTYSSTATYNGTDPYYISNISTIAPTLFVNATLDSDQELTVRITSPNTTIRYEMPHEEPYPYTRPGGDVSKPVFSLGKGDGIIISRAQTTETVFDTTGADFLFSEYYTTFTIKLPSQYLYGLGERNRDFLYESGTYTIWNKDQFASVDDGQGNQQTYGAHPVYLMREASGNWHVVYLRTTNALDFIFDADNHTLKFLLTSNFVELKFFFGDQNPDTAIAMYHRYINGWAVQPFWSHGYHQCRWGYLFLDDFTHVVNNMSDNGLPLDVIWSDIDYMDNFTDFTFDEDRYPVDDFKKLIEQVHWIPIIDAGVFINYTSPAYTRGNELNVWIQSALNNSNYLVGMVWPGLVYWPDWLNPNSTQYWDEMLSALYDLVPYSGIWLDMNENSNFCFGEFADHCFMLPNYLPDGGDGHIDPHSQPINPIPVDLPEPPKKDGKTVPPEIVSFNSTYLPYVPGSTGNGTDLDQQTLSINALHMNNILDFDVHNLNGFWEAKATYESLYSITHKRPFILTRSTHVGSGQFATHWTGDNTAEWIHLRLSIPEIFNFQIYGIPMTGADICGFAGNTTEELCARWMQLGAFYPFMRNHNKIDAFDQEPYALGPTVLNTSRAALHFRYSILKFYYSIFIRNNHVGTVFRPVFFDYPDLELLNLQTQFLIGSELMVAAVVDEGAKTVAVFFPANSKWFRFDTGRIACDVGEGPITKTYGAPLNASLPVYIRAGSIVHTQDTTDVLSSKMLNEEFTLVIALTQTGTLSYAAAGQMMSISDYQDDGSVEGCLGTHDCLIQINATTVIQDDGTVAATLQFSQNSAKSYLEEIYITDVVFYGVRTDPCPLTGTKECGEPYYKAHCVYPSSKMVQYETYNFTLTSNGEGDLTCTVA